MKTISTNKAPIAASQIAIVRENLKQYIDKTVTVSENTGNQKYTHYQGKFLSISSNIFSIEIPLGKTNKTIKSFPLNDILIGKISIQETK